MNRKGLMFNIQRFCLQDGPGIRTTVFFKGCPLRCAWCHNPESQTSEIEVLRKDGKDEICGFDMTAEAVMAEVLKDKVFYENSGGGLTLSGGEPLLQPEFAYGLLKLAKQNGLHTCVETCGFGKTEDILKIAEVTDLFLYDWKLTDDSLHKAYTGVSNRLILENLQAIDEAGVKTVLRCPMIPGVNDTAAHLLGIAQRANELVNMQAVELEPYHDLGVSKYARLGRACSLQNCPQPSDRQVEEWIDLIRTHTALPVRAPR